jgi:DNA-binding protein
MKKIISNEIIIGNKEIEKYMFVVVSKFEKEKELTLKSCGKNIMKMERIIRLLKNFNISEIERESSDIYTNIPLITCKIKNGNINE